MIHMPRMKLQEPKMIAPPIIFPAPIVGSPNLNWPLIEKFTSILMLIASKSEPDILHLKPNEVKELTEGVFAKKTKDKKIELYLSKD